MGRLRDRRLNRSEVGIIFARLASYVRRFARVTSHVGDRHDVGDV